MMPTAPSIQGIHRARGTSSVSTRKTVWPASTPAAASQNRQPAVRRAGRMYTRQASHSASDVYWRGMSANAARFI